MAPLPVIESKVLIQAGRRRGHSFVSVQINLLVLHTPPQPLDEDFVDPESLAVDIDRHARILGHVKDVVNGHTTNIGGGLGNTMSLRETLSFLEEALVQKILLAWVDWHPGDQPVIVCNISNAKNLMAWEPEISVYNRVHDLTAWVSNNKAHFS